MRILLTGATGFIGQHFLKKMNKQYDIYTIGRSNPLNYKNFISWNFNEKANINDVPEQVDTIVHLAQSRRYREFPEGAQDMFSVNVSSTANLLDLAVKLNIKHFILMSTGTVYEPFLSLCQEDMKLQPKSFYASSKYASEIITNSYSSLMKICIFRLFFPYGPGQTGRLIPDLINKIANNLPITLDGENGMKISPIYIDDIIKILKATMQMKLQGTFNLTSPNMLSIKDMGEVISEKLKKKVTYDIKSYEKLLDIKVDLIKLLSNFPDFKFVPFRDGISKVINHHCSRNEVIYD